MLSFRQLRDVGANVRQRDELTAARDGIVKPSFPTALASVRFDRNKRQAFSKSARTRSNVAAVPPVHSLGWAPG
jgi:hypothetical protein